MQTLKEHFNAQARQTYLDLLVLWWLLLSLVLRFRRLENETNCKFRSPLRL